MLYAIGKPTEAVDPDMLDVKEWELFQQGQATAEQMTAAMGGLPLELACHMVRAARGPLADAKAQLMAQTLAQGQVPEAADQQDDAASGDAEQALPDPAADRAEASVGTEAAGGAGARPAPERRRAPKPPGTGAGRQAQRVGGESASGDVPGGPGGVPGAEAIERLLGRGFAAEGAIPLESAEDFRRNLLRDG